jgi:hypothetical protein
MFGTSSLTLSVPETAKYLMEIQRNSIGLDEWFKRFDDHGYQFDSENRCGNDR